MRRMRQSKTMWFSIALVIFGALEMYFPYIRDNLQPEYYGPLFMLIGVIVALLRFITTGPIR
jgi:hypothetical protein